MSATLDDLRTQDGWGRPSWQTQRGVLHATRYCWFAGHVSLCGKHARPKLADPHDPLNPAEECCPRCLSIRETQENAAK